MAQITDNLTDSNQNGESGLNKVLRILLSLGIAAVVLLVLRWSVDFMRNPEAPEQLLLRMYETLGMEQAAADLFSNGLDPLTSKLIIMAVALTVGVVGIWALFWVANDLIATLPHRIREGVRPIVFIAPAILLLSTFLIYPALNTIYLSFTEDIIKMEETVPEALIGADNIAELLAEDARNVTFRNYLYNGDNLELALLEANEKAVLLLVRNDNISTFGLHNYVFAFTDPAMRIAFRNNIMWLIVGTLGSVTIGLIFATLVDRIKREALAKVFIFLPLAISFVGASVIWRFVYAWQPANRAQIGILNAMVTALGGEPVPWLIESPGNTMALIVIMVWLQTGFAMVILSAALKGVPNEIVEAARIDGATEFQLFFRIIIPSIRGAIITVATTIFIAILKVFDIVYVMTSGKFDTEVIANRMFVEMFNFRNFGRASALAVILLVVVIPIMYVNIRNLRRQGINQ